MHNAPDSIDDVFVELVNDEETPYDFVTGVIQSVFGKNVEEARELTNAIHRNGSARLGPFAPAIARSMIDVLRKRAEHMRYPLVARVSDAKTTGDAIACGFCGKMQADCKFIYQGRGVYICDVCVINGARALQTATPSAVMRNIYELLDSMALT